MQLLERLIQQPAPNRRGSILIGQVPNISTGPRGHEVVRLVIQPVIP